MKTKKLLLVSVISLVAAAAFVTSQAINPHTETENAVLLANIEALTKIEGMDYNNAKLAYCNSYTDRQGCKGALGRKCYGIFCN